MNKTGRGSFSADHQPGKRGPAFKTRVMNAIRKQALLGLPENATHEEAEAAFLANWAKRAHDAADQSSGMLLKAMVDKCYANIKPSFAAVNFEFDAKLSPTEKVDQIIQAASNGTLEPDIATTFIKSVKDGVDIEQATDLKSRIEAMEKMLKL
jgi:hypothetical protein